MRLVIAGGGPAALAAARAYREAGGDGDVTLVTPEATTPYERPPLSKRFLRGEIGESELVLEPAAWYVEHGVTVRNDLVTAIEPGTVKLRDETLHYDACVVATGSVPAPPSGHALVLRSLADARALKQRAERKRTATVIGSGFIGCEAAASLAMRGLDVTLVSQEEIPHAARLGAEAGRRIAGFLTDLGVTLELGRTLSRLPDGLVLVATGVEPAGPLGRITVDERMRSELPGVYAAGDVAFARNAAAGRHLAVEHWGEALNMGAVAGRTIAGEDARWDVAPGFWSTIGERTVKYAAWGDGYDEARLVDHGGGAFTVWYGTDGTTVGVLTHERDEDYERGRHLVETKAPLP
ncbi:MAG TPA: FAD-dependent oxidoreductase [Solirubrobacter sp.]|nr:FAD-dependent oxidoreductase [Solirubrobacter sp.]